MAKLFQITLPDGMSELKLDSQGRATLQYNVANKSARPIDARAVLVPLPQSNPPDPNHPVSKGWIKVTGTTDQHMEADKACTYTVNIAIPMQKNPAPPGTYSFRLDVVSVAKTDEGDSSQPLKFTVTSAPKPRPKWGLIVAIAAVVVVCIGLLVWALTRHSTKGTTSGDNSTSGSSTSAGSTKPAKTTVPNGLAGMTLSAASNALHTSNLTVGLIQGDGTTVISSAPAPGTTVESGSSVTLTTQSTAACAPPNNCVYRGAALTQRMQTLGINPLYQARPK